MPHRSHKKNKKRKKARTSVKPASSERTPEKTKPKKGLTLKTGFIIVATIALIIAAVVIVQRLMQKKPEYLTIVYPFDGSLFPPEIIPPTFLWEDKDPGVNAWQVTLEFAEGDPVRADVDTTKWTPDRDLWESIKARSMESRAKFTVRSLKKTAGMTRTAARRSITISTSTDSVGAPIFYRDVPLPFRFALRNVRMIKWRLGEISSHEPPPVVLTNLPVCGNCHTFSLDGSTLGMDVDIGNDKGAYVLTGFDEETVLSREKLISWSDYVPEVPTFGMLPNVSPDGRYVLSGVKDRSVFLPRRNILFSQIFFPVMGIIAYYDSHTRQIRALPGADDEEYVQANAGWSPDGKTVVFARNKAFKLTAESDPFKDIILNKDESVEVLGGEQFLESPQETPQKFMYSLYRVPFNDGKGGKVEPIPGASHNGMSNYFPKYSPDGKWLVFTQAHSFMLLQPDAALYIMPAEGGTPRRMNCNTNRMNSWHSWSPNGKWLVFSSKVFTPNTQLFLTHIDENGIDTPPVLLKNFTPLDEDRGANIPEFVNIEPGATRIIRERFLDDYNYFRSGRIYEQFREYDRAADEYRKSLEINPRSTFSHYSLGTIYAEEEDWENARKEFETVARLDPENPIVHKDLGSLYFRMKDYAKAEREFMTTIRLDPGDAAAHNNLGSLYMMKRRPDLAESEFRAALRLETRDDNKLGIHFNLGRLYIAGKDYAKAKTEFMSAIAIDPDNTDAHHNLGNLYNLLKDMNGAIEEFEAVKTIDARNVDAYIELGRIYAENNDTDLAIREFRGALEQDPENIYARIYLGRLYSDKEDYAGAKREFFTILEQDADNVFAHINLGMLYTETEEYDDAIEEFKKVLMIDPKDARACFMLGELLSEKKHADREAIQYLRQGLSLNPRHFDGYILIGNCYLNIGEIHEALEVFESAQRLRPEDAELKARIEGLRSRIAEEEKRSVG